jgi:hypothetical protein
MGKANALGEEMGVCNPEAAGAGVQTPVKGSEEITSGKANEQQGLVTTCKDQMLMQNEAWGVR